MVSVMVDDLADPVIRRATVDDAEPIARVHVASVRHAYAGLVDDAYLAGLDVDARAAWWRDLLESPGAGTTVWVAEEESGTVGFLSLGPSGDEDADRRTMQVHTLYLEPAAWGRGIARELMRTALADVPEGAPVTLWVPAANDRARHFYRRNGFTADGVERVEDVDGEPLREVRYRRD